MGIGTSIFLIAVGAIFRYAITAEVAGIKIDTIGLILMVVGVIGLLISLFYMTVWSRRRTVEPVAERTVVRDREVY